MRNPEENNPNTLPNPPVIVQDLPAELPSISQEDILVYANAEQVYRLARADRDHKKSKLVLLLLQFCTPEPGVFEAWLDDDQALIVIENSSTVPDMLKSNP